MSADLIQIIIFAMVAAFVALRLIATFGRNPGDEQPTASEGFARRETRGPLGANADQLDANAAGEVAYLHADPVVRECLAKMGRLDRRFDPVVFLDGARQAYEMILDAFWKGDDETLKPFVDADILANFQAAIKAREEAGHTNSNRLVTLNKADVSDATLNGKEAQITVAFEADIIAATHDKDGNLIEGSMSDTHQVKDRWTFARTLGSRDPNWTLVETASAD